MDYEHRKGGDKRASFLQGDENFHKILSRNSSVGCSSRIYYYQNAEGVPFNWEMQPGKSKEPPKDEVIPPISPPPAVLSLGLPKPCIEVHPSKQAQKTWPTRLRFWYKSKKKKMSKNINIAKARSRGSHDGSDKTERFEFCSSDCEFMASSPQVSCSSSSSSLSFSNGPLVQSSRLGSPGRDSFHGPLSCSPWNISTILVSIVRRV